MKSASYAHKARVEALRNLVREHGSQAQFARRYGLDASYISQILSGHRSFGEKSARNMEDKIGLPAGTLDGVLLQSTANTSAGNQSDNEAISQQKLAALQSLKGKATPRTVAALDRIENAAKEGRLTEEDILLLEGIAQRFEKLRSDKS